jgi:hypothetical protein
MGSPDICGHQRGCRQRVRLLLAATRAQPQDRVCPARSAQPTATVRLPQSQRHSQMAFQLFRIDPACAVTVSRPQRLPVISFTRGSIHSAVRSYLSLPRITCGHWRAPIDGAGFEHPAVLHVRLGAGWHVVKRDAHRCITFDFLRATAHAGAARVG